MTAALISIDGMTDVTDLPIVSPAELGPSIDALFAPWNRPDSPGAVVAVTHRGREIHRGIYGMAELAHGLPLTSRSVIRIASQSKQFTV
ncbi:MAG TPA: serine hydrolase domain-containing protein, partial [Alphaproteobacteria bacterium]|nr:serine hydrolase domain-containing protein [Alphaproteobacteria bacterium]